MSLVQESNTASASKDNNTSGVKPGLVFLPFDGGLIRNGSFELTPHSLRIVDMCRANNSTLILTTHRTRSEMDILFQSYPEYFRQSVPFITEYGAELVIPVGMGVEPLSGAARRVSSQYILPLWSGSITLKGIHNIYQHLRRKFAIVSLLDISSEALAKKMGTSVALVDALKLRACTLPILLKAPQSDSLPLKQFLEGHKLTVAGEGALQYIMHPSCDKSIAMGVAEVLFAESKQEVHFSVGIGADNTDKKLMEYCDYPIKIKTTAPDDGVAQVFRQLSTFFTEKAEK